MMKKNKLVILGVLSAVAQLSMLDSPPVTVDTATGTLKITFINTVKQQPLVLDSFTYTNPSNEEYTVTKFRYYISHIKLQPTTNAIAEKNSYHLVDARKPGSMSFSFPAAAGNYSGFSFLLGVDSLKNVSGAQSGALDPINDMFWTWNTGYVMLKMEGNSPAANVMNNKVEYHIGGFKGDNNVLRNIKLPFNLTQQLKIASGKTTELIIETDLDKMWQDPNTIKISATPVCTTPGLLARNIADNYSKMFAVKTIINPQP